MANLPLSISTYPPALYQHRQFYAIAEEGTMRSKVTAEKSLMPSTWLPSTSFIAQFPSLFVGAVHDPGPFVNTAISDEQRR